MIYALEGLRGIAALVVSLFHGWDSTITALFAQGWLCVDLFFVISGFVMAHVYGQLSTGAQATSFAIKRIGRLYPLHLATLAGFIACEAALQLAKPLAGMAGHDTNPVTLDLVEGWSLLSNLLLLHGMGLPGARVYNNASWSISTELWACALFAVSCLLFRGRSRMFAWAALSVAGLVIFMSFGEVDSVNSGAYFFRCVYGFFLGALLPSLQGGRASPRPAIVGCMQAAAIAGTVIAFATVGQVFAVRYVAPLVFALLVYSVSFDRGPLASLLRVPVFQLLGRLSYSIYMTHSLVLVFFNPLGSALAEPCRSLLNVVYVIVVLGISALTHRWIEEPWRKRFQVYAQRPPAAPSAVKDRPGELLR